MHVPVDKIDRQAESLRRPTGESILHSSTLSAAASNRGRDHNDEGRVALDSHLI